MHKRLASVVMAAVLLVSGLMVAGCPPEAPVEASVPGEGVGPTTITILHTGDFHGRLDPFKPRRAEEYIGGIARIATLVNQIRVEEPNTILLDAGDTIHGTNLANLIKGESVIAAMNAMGFTAMVVGNHDFNYGDDVLLERAEQAEFPLLGANVRYQKTGEPFLPPYTIVEAGGLEIGIIGLVTTRTPIVTHPKNVQDLEFLDLVTVTRAIVEQIAPRVDLIVLLAHTGTPEVRRVLMEVPGIAVSVNADAHLEQVEQIGDTILAHSGEHGKVLGRLDIVVENGRVIDFSHEFLRVTPDVEDDPDVNGVLAPYREQVGIKLAEVIGEAEVVLDGEREDIRSRETNLGNLVADVIRERAGADVAIQNSGGIRATIDAGPITLEEIFTVLPFDNYVVALRLTGKTIWEALENAVSDESPTGAFPQVSGMSFVFDPARPSGDRIVEVTIGGEPLDLERTYVVATNCFLAAGGDKFTMLKDAEVLLETGDFLRDAVAAYIRERRTIRPEVEGRIQRVQEVARNVIFFHPDGYGLSHWNALRAWLVGPDGRLNWDRLPYMAPYTGHMKDALTGSSAGGATVHAYGVKVAFDSFGMDGDQVIIALSGRQMSIMEEAIKAGFATALIQTGSVTDAGTGTSVFVASTKSPGVFIPPAKAHNLREKRALQLIESGVDVMLGGDEAYFLPEGVTGRHGEGRRKDGLNLIERARDLGYTVVFDREELNEVATGTETRVLGVFASGPTFNALTEEELRARGLPHYCPEAPTIAEMAAATLQILARHPQAATIGFFIVAEEEGTDNFPNAANASGSFVAGKRADEAFGVFADFVEENPNTLVITVADSSAGGKDIVSLPPRMMEMFMVDGKVPEVEINTGPDGEFVLAPMDGVHGAGTEPFLSAPDRKGNRWPFAVLWAMRHDLSGGIVARAKGLNADLVTELGVVDNTDIYRIMYYTLFGQWLGEAR
ncbi:5'-nucleotidase C-terminal domain-containing protein [Dehalococcoidia bacterium]|nr:5'-nucleotidase C-terminal domain-containing protein [Dehalococcoidia bacterium]